MGVVGGGAKSMDAKDQSFLGGFLHLMEYT